MFMNFSDINVIKLLMKDIFFFFLNLRKFCGQINKLKKNSYVTITYKVLIKQF